MQNLVIILLYLMLLIRKDLLVSFLSLTWIRMATSVSSASPYKLTPLKLGAEVHGISLQTDPPSEVIQHIKDDVHKHRLLVFRDQGIVMKILEFLTLDSIVFSFSSLDLYLDPLLLALLVVVVLSSWLKHWCYGKTIGYAHTHSFRHNIVYLR